ncbi:MAG: hypothetical protein ACKO7X_05375 [Bacteroidota bacterium]
MAFMERDPGGWDMVFASGILYHMQDPMRFLALLPKLAPRMLLWTHFYDERIVRDTPALAHKFGPLQHGTHDGQVYEFVEQSYKEALQWSGFCGGSAPTSLWLTRDNFSVGIARRSSRVPDSPKNGIFFLKKELCGQLESVFPGYQRQNVAHLLTYWAHIKAYLSLILNIIELK